MRVLTVIALLLLSTVAMAQQPSPAPADAAQSAREAFTEGTAFFNLGQWDRAIESWERGYRLKSDAVFLYNIAQAYRLADQPERALFFYRNYLRIVTNAPNRAEVEQRIAQLEKAVAARQSARETPPADPLPPPPKTVAAPPPKARRLDLDLGVGVRLWAVGVSATPSLALQLGAGYAVIQRGRLALRIGGDIGYSYLKDIASTDHFISIMATPAVRIRLWRERLYLVGEIGLGAQVVAGLKSGSALLNASSSPSAVALFVVRPRVALEVQLTPAVSLWLAPALAYSPLPSSFGERALVEVDLLAGIGVRP